MTRQAGAARPTSRSSGRSKPSCVPSRTPRSPPASSRPGGRAPTPIRPGPGLALPSSLGGGAAVLHVDSAGHPLRAEPRHGHARQRGVFHRGGPQDDAAGARLQRFLGGAGIPDAATLPAPSPARPPWRCARSAPTAAVPRMPRPGRRRAAPAHPARRTPAPGQAVQSVHLGAKAIALPQPHRPTLEEVDGRIEHQGSHAPPSGSARKRRSSASPSAAALLRWYCTPKSVSARRPPGFAPGRAPRPPA